MRNKSGRIHLKIIWQDMVCYDLIIDLTSKTDTSANPRALKHLNF